MTTASTYSLRKIVTTRGDDEDEDQRVDELQQEAREAALPLGRRQRVGTEDRRAGAGLGRLRPSVPSVSRRSATSSRGSGVPLLVVETLDDGPPQKPPAGAGR